MNKKTISILLALFTFTLLALAACGGGGGGGGSSTSTPTATPTEDTAFTKADLAGYWHYDAGRFSGTMSFDTAGNPIYVTVDTCSYTTHTVTVIVDNTYSTSAYNVRIRAYGYCYDANQLLKFAVNTTSDKKAATGIVDRHLNGDGGEYRRYSCTMVKQ